MKNVRRFLLLCSLTAALAGCTNSTTEEADAEDNQEQIVTNDTGTQVTNDNKPLETLKGTMGETLTFNKISITLEGYEQAAVYDDPEMSYVFCHIRIQNNSEYKQYIYPDTFSLQNDRGEELEVIGGSYSGAQVVETFDNFYLGSGGEFSGDLVFRTGSDDSNFVLHYYSSEFPGNEPAMSWDFKTEYPEALKEAEDYQYAGIPVVDDIETQELNPGETGTSNGISVTVSNPVFLDNPDNDINHQADTEYLILDVKIENNTGERLDYYSNFWMLEDSGKSEYLMPSSWSVETNDVIHDGRLVDGGWTEGQLLYCIPKGKDSLKLNFYSDLKWGKPELSWIIR